MCRSPLPSPTALPPRIQVPGRTSPGSGWPARSPESARSLDPNPTRGTRGIQHLRIQRSPSTCSLAPQAHRNDPDRVLALQIELDRGSGQSLDGAGTHAADSVGGMNAGASAAVAVVAVVAFDGSSLYGGCQPLGCSELVNE